jgi:hypothetical protein
MISSRLARFAGIGVVAVVVALPHALTVEAATTTLDSYAASAESWGLDIREIAIPVQAEIPDILDEYLPHTAASVNSLPHAVADGEFFDPGASVRVGPGLVNGVLLGPAGVPPIVPKYPYLASATSDASSKHDVDAGTAQPFTPEPALVPVAVPGLPVPSGFGVGTAHAHADNTPLADATGTVAGVTLGLVDIGSAAGESTARQANGLVSATTTSTMSDVTIAGVLRIAQATASATIQTSGPGTAKTTQGVTYSGVTVAGIPATIDENGLHINGTDVPADVANAALKQLNSALAAAHAQLIPPTATGVTKPDGSATVSIAGFGLDTTDGANYDAQISLGRAELSLRARPSRPVAPGSVSVAPLPPIDLGAPPPVSITPVLPAAVAAPASAPAPVATKPAPTVRHTVPATVELASSGQRKLVLPFVAVLAELSLVLLCIQAYRWKRAAVESPEDLLAL